MANPLRIVHLDSSRVWRGGQQQLLLLARGLRELGCEQLLVARPGEVAERLRQAGFPVLAPGWSAWRQVRRAPVAHAHDGRAHAWLLLATATRHNLRVLGRRVAYSIPAALSRWKYRRLDLVIAVSDSARREVLATGLDPARVVVIPDALDRDELPDAEAARLRVRRHAGLDPANRYLVCLGAFSPEKGLADLIAALPHLPANCILLLPGEGPERAALERQAQALGLSRRVRFVASPSVTPAEWVAAADLFLMPSRAEGLGSAALLAMALGRPIVATTAGGIPELVENEVTGLLVSPANPTALADACLRLLAQPELGRRLAAAALGRVQERHTATRLAADTLAAYRRHLALPGKMNEGA